jgi:hypothetical protein
MIPGVEQRQFTFSSLHGYLVVLLKHARLIVLLALLSLTGGVGYWLYAKPVYYVKALIQVRLLSKAADNNIDYGQGGEAQYQTLRLEFQSDHILERTAAGLGIRARQDRIKRQQVRAVMVNYSSENNLIVEIYSYSLDLAERWEELEASDNPFAAVVMAHLKTQTTRRRPENRLQWKVRLLRWLYREGRREEEFVDLFRFLDLVMPLPYKQQFLQQVLDPFEYRRVVRDDQRVRSHVNADHTVLRQYSLYLPHYFSRRRVGQRVQLRHLRHRLLLPAFRLLLYVVYPARVLLELEVPRLKDKFQ